jgi:RNA polymerase-binding transcription factor DksA
MSPFARLGSMTADRESPFAASIGSKADDEHDTEGHSIGYERAQLSALIRHAQAHLSDVDDATARLRAGRYGICEAWREHIPAGQLEAGATARTCIRHAAR